MLVIGFNWVMAHDNTASAIVDGRLVFSSEEERYTRHKHANGEPPYNALIAMFKYLKDKFDISPLDVDAFAINHDPRLMPWRVNLGISTVGSFFTVGKTPEPPRHKVELFKALVSSAYDPLESARFFLRTVYHKMGYDFPENVRIYPVPHHLAHAASAYYFMNHNSAVLLTIDGIGERESAAVWKAKSGEFEKVWDIDANEASFGHLYEAMSQKIGFNFLEGPGKVMGLAPYGRPRKDIQAKLDRCISVKRDGDSLSFSIRNPNGTVPNVLDDYIGVTANAASASEYMAKGLDLEWDARAKTLKRDAVDLSWALQNRTEQLVLELADWAKEQTGETYLGLSGGVALNAKANMAVHYSKKFDDIFIFPAASDAGGPSGAAAYVYEHVLGGKMQHGRMTDAYLGPEYSDDDVKALLDKGRWKKEYIGDDVGAVAELIRKGKIVTWYQGRAELGPRALGDRSIVADPTMYENWRRINTINNREWWRPLAPSLLESEVERYFVDPAPHHFMINMFRFRDEVKKDVPAVVHVDGTARPQTVTKAINKNWYNLIKSFEELSGEGVIINTSFNLAGEPVVETPFDALRSFAVSGFDAIYMQGWLVEK